MRGSCVFVGCLLALSCVQAIAFTEQETRSRLASYRSMLTTYFASPRHPVGNEEQWLYARNGVLEILTASVRDVKGAKVVQLDFQTEVANPGQPSIHVPVKGENIIAIFEGTNWKTAEDKIIVIGAHYDTNSNSQGMTDNGSGMSAVLEIAREISNSLRNGGVLENTVIFAAFDVQKMEHSTTAPIGYVGSHHFVNSFLAPILYPSDGTAPMFRGAIILDSIMNYSPDRNTQLLPSDFEKTFPEAHKYITGNLSNTGNYICAISKQQPVRYAGLALDFHKYWNATVNPAKYPIVDLEILKTLGTQSLTEFLKQDHMPFWNFFHLDRPTPLPAILLTDTGIWRTTPRCTTVECKELLTPERLDFLDQTVVTLITLIEDMQFDPKTTTTSSSTGLDYSFLILLVSFLFRKISVVTVY